MRFEELNLSTPLLEAVAQLDFTEMTEIQEKAIPLLLENLEEDDDVQNVFHNWSMPEED